MALISAGKPPSEGIAGLILAGGLARRMGGGDKSLIRLGGQTLLARAIERLRPQVAELALSANGPPERFQDAGLAVLADPLPGHRGPLAGVLAGLAWAGARGLSWLVSVPCDTPFFPRDLVGRLIEASAGHDIVCAGSGGRRHPVCALWSAGLEEDLRRALADGADLGVESFMARHRTGLAAWLDKPYDPFLNINTPGDMAEAQRVIAEVDP